MFNDLLVIAEFSPSSYHYLSKLGGLLILVYCLVALKRGQFAVLGIPAYCAMGTAHTRLFGFSTGLIALVISAVTLLYLWLTVVRQGRINMRREIMEFTIPRLFLLGCAIVAVKCGVESMLLGLDEYRVQALKFFVTDVFLPFLVLYLASSLQGCEKAVRDFMTGAFIICLIWLGTGFLGVLLDGHLARALQGKLRLGLHNLDTINSVRLIPLFTLSCLFLFFQYRSVSAKVLVLMPLGLVGLILILNGTRQYLFTVGLTLLLVTLLCRSSSRFRQLALLIFILCVGFGFFRNIYSTSALGQRLTSTEMITDGRFATWQAVLERSWDHPFLGDGFRVFGDRFYMKDPITGQVEVSKDSAHGFFMDVAADHGLVLGLGLLGLWMLAWVRSLFLATRIESDQWRLCLIAFLAWPIALLFSGSFWGAFYMAVPLALVVSLERDNLLFQPPSTVEPESPAVLSSALSARAGSVAGD